MNAPQPPLPDIDWTEAVEKAEDVLRRYGLEPDSVLGSAACDVVRAVWPILHAAAQPTSVEYGLRRGIDIVRGHSRDGARSNARVLNGMEPGSVEVVCRTLGDWQPVEWEEANADEEPAMTDTTTRRTL